MQRHKGLPIKAFPGQDHQAHIMVKQSFIADPTLGQNPVMQALVPILQANIREHMIMQYEEQMSGMLTQGVEQAGVKTDEAISKITQGAAQEILQNNQRMAEQGNVQDLERMTLELQRQQLELEREKVKIDAAQKAANIAIQEEKLDLEKDKVEVDAAEKLAKIKGVARDREIVAESKTADRDDKFLIEMIKLLMKETGATVEKLKEEVTLRPETFNQGGTVFGMIGDYANQLGVSIMDLINQLGSYFDSSEPEASGLDLQKGTPLTTMLPQPSLTLPQRPTDLGKATSIDTEDYLGTTSIGPMEGYEAPTIGEVEVEELEKIPEDTITDRFAMELRKRSTPEAFEAWKKENPDAFKKEPVVQEDVSTEVIDQITDGPPAIERKVEPSKGVPSLPSPGMPQEPRGASTLAPILGILEGTRYHKDQKNIKTAPYGVVIDPKRTAAYTKNKEVADRFGYDLNKLTKSQALVVASEVADDVSGNLGRELGTKYNKLSPQSQALVIDAKFNTGTTYKDLVNALTKYEKAPSNETLKDVIAESRRTVKEDGVTKTSVGQDNRVAKLIFSLGFLSPTKENVDFINKSFNVTGKAKWSNIKGFYN